VPTGVPVVLNGWEQHLRPRTAVAVGIPAYKPGSIVAAPCLTYSACCSGLLRGGFIRRALFLETSTSPAVGILVSRKHYRRSGTPPFKD
jgi:hypothetical protein